MAYIRFFNPHASVCEGNCSGEAYNRFMRENFPSAGHGPVANSPAANISESEKDFKIELALPGISKSDIKMEYNKGLLTISVEAGTDEPGDVYRRREFRTRGISRTFRISEKIDNEAIKAEYNQGILAVILPKKESFVGQASRSISVE